MTILTRLVPALGLLSSAIVALPQSCDDSSIQAGYHVVYSYPGSTPPSTLIDNIEQGRVGGILLFEENIGSDITSVVSSFTSAYAKSPCYDSSRPLLIVTDQEGGEVRRIPDGGPQLSEKDVGSSSDPSSAATTAGEQAADTLSGASINGNLAPVLGVYREEGDFLDQYERSYSNDSSIVSECAAAFITAQQGCGIVATAKHFPGLGAASASDDTDAEPVTINLSLDELRSVDEAPYEQAIAAGVKMVMPSWALYPALDDEFPSGLSSKWIQDELRGRLGFAGVTISDAIEAGGLEGFGNDGNRAVMATEAGMDIILAAARDDSQGSDIVDALAAAVDNGTLDADDFAAATERILEMRGGL